MTQTTQKKRKPRREPPFIGIVFLLAALAFILMRWNTGTDETGEAGSTDTQTAPAPRRWSPRSKRTLISAMTSAAETAFTPLPAIDQNEDDHKDGNETEVETPRKRAVARWENLVDKRLDLTGAPSLEVAETFKKSFEALDADDQEDSIVYALNLLTDEQFPVLYLILFDKRQDPDILDAIFNDALNRDESIKNPMMIELRKDEEHPMYFESARILDVIED